jgi:hypothetical protein
MQSIDQVGETIPYLDEELFVEIDREFVKLDARRRLQSKIQR